MARFEKGHTGRPPGTLNAKTKLFKEVVQPDLPAILRKIVEQALQGCLSSQQLVWKKYAPENLGNLFEMPRDDQFNATETARGLIDNMLAGELSPEECGKALHAISTFETIIQATSDRDKLDRILKANEQ